MEPAIVPAGVSHLDELNGVVEAARRVPVGCHMLAQLLAALVVPGLMCGCTRTERAPDLATRIAETCASAGCQIRLDALVPSAWDTVWLVNRPLKADLDALPELPLEARKTLGEWDDGLGNFNAMVGTLDGHVVWTDACENNINENFNPPPYWWVVGDGDSGWARRSREAAVFEVARHIGPTENSVVLQPIPPDSSGTP